METPVFDKFMEAYRVAHFKCPSDLRLIELFEQHYKNVSEMFELCLPENWKGEGKPWTDKEGNTWSDPTHDFLGGVFHKAFRSYGVIDIPDWDYDSDKVHPDTICWRIIAGESEDGKDVYGTRDLAFWDVLDEILQEYDKNLTSA